VQRPDRAAVSREFLIQESGIGDGSFEENLVQTIGLFNPSLLVDVYSMGL
jgi:hypothetical protein